MSMRSDHKALLFLGAIAVLGATVRVARAVGATAAPANAALEHQMQAADSAKRRLAEKQVAKQAAKQRRAAAGQLPAGRAAGAAPAPTAAVERGPHWDFKGRLDLDVATAAEIDSLPGVGPTLAKRIAADRLVNGPFRELHALRRVRGVSPKLLGTLDSVVAFSGAYKAPLASDTLIPPKKRR